MKMNLRNVTILSAILYICCLANCNSGGDSEKKKVASPVFSLEGGTYDSDISVTVTCDTEDAVIYYS